MAVLDTHWHANPKVLALGLYGMALHAWSISYCDAELTDGFIPAAALPQLAGVKQGARSLVAAGMWQEVAGGYRLHDYLRHNRSRELVLSKRDRERIRKSSARPGGSVPESARIPAGVAAESARNDAGIRPESAAYPVPEYVNSRPPARLAGRTARPRARGDGDLQPLSTFVVGGLSEMPDEVQERLGRPAIGQPAKPASPAKNLSTGHENALG